MNICECNKGLEALRLFRQLSEQEQVAFLERLRDMVAALGDEGGDKRGS